MGGKRKGGKMIRPGDPMPDPQNKVNEQRADAPSSGPAPGRQEQNFQQQPRAPPFPGTPQDDPFADLEKESKGQRKKQQWGNKGGGGGQQHQGGGGGQHHQSQAQQQQPNQTFPEPVRKSANQAHRPRLPNDPPKQNQPPRRYEEEKQGEQQFERQQRKFDNQPAFDIGAELEAAGPKKKGKFGKGQHPQGQYQQRQSNPREGNYDESQSLYYDNAGTPHGGHKQGRPQQHQNQNYQRQQTGHGYRGPQQQYQARQPNQGQRYDDGRHRQEDDQIQESYDQPNRAAHDNRRKQRERKNPPKNMPKFENPADALFEAVITEVGSKIDSKVKDTVVQAHRRTAQHLNSLHHYIQDQLVFPPLNARLLTNHCLLPVTQPPSADPNVLSPLIQLQSDQDQFTNHVLLTSTEAVLSGSLERTVLHSYEEQYGAQVDRTTEWLEKIDGAKAANAAPQVQPQAQLDDNEIDDLLAMASDPFAAESQEPEDPSIALPAGLKELKDITCADEVNEIVNQINRKQQEIKIRAEEEQVRVVEDKVKAKMEGQQRRKEEEQEARQGQQLEEEAKQKDDSDEDEEIRVIIKEEVGRRELPVEDEGAGEVQAQPQKFNHAQAALNEQSMIISRLMQDEQQDEKEVVAAVIDDMPMDDFDQLLPPHNRAIVYDFELDVFQKRAVYRLEQGECVFVAAHTSAGKTVVAEYAIALSLKHMTKTIFTSPIKALSNQKFRDFKQKFEDVGILTGDVSINRDATCVIMTTEVLQNQLYSDSDYLQDVEWVIFDEVHYIDDAERGSVWEEVIMKLPDHISIVMLSATVGNYMQFAEWVGRTKKKTIYVQCTYQRPVPLEHFMIYGQKLTLVKAGEEQLDREKVKKIIIKNHEDAKQQKMGGGGKKPGKGEMIKMKEDALKKKISNAMGDGEKLNSAKQRKHENFFKNLNHIKRQNLLPCVVFVFSRAQVESIAADVDEHLNFVDNGERNRIREFKKKALQKLDDGDRDLPQVVRLCDLVDRGIGFHHAGMIPLLKEIVEILFTDNLLKVVFATSTFAIGLNMPARSVVFTQQKKHNGKTQEILTATEYLQMAGRAGRRGKDDSGASILCVDDSFGKVPHSDEFNEMFDNKGKDLESKLKMTYKTSLNLLNQEGQEFESLITNSFFSDETEKKRIQAIGLRKQLIPRIDKVSRIECDQCEVEEIHAYYDSFLDLQQQNIRISKECGLVPIVLKINLIMTPMNKLQHAIIIAKVPQKIKKNMDVSKKPKDEWLAVVLQNEADYTPSVAYREDEDYETAKLRAEEELAQLKEAKGTQWWKKKGGKDLKVEGFEQGYHYEYMRITLGDVVEVYRNELQVDQKFVVTNDLLTNSVLKRLVMSYDYNIKEKGLDPIRPTKGKVKQLQQKREELLNELQSNPAFNSKKLSHHLTQCQRLRELQGKLQECEDLIDMDSNEKLDEFNAKNKVLEGYKMIDEEQNMLFKGKVARVVKSVDPILLTQLIFSGWLKKISDEEMLALLSVLVEQVRAGRDHQMLQTRISDNFWNACLFLEGECNKLIDTEQKHGVLDQQQDPYRRLNYYFYEIVYDWAKKKSFLQIKSEHPGLEEGIVIKCIMSVQSLCRTVKEMNNLIGDEVLAQRMEDASKLLDREIMSTQSLYFQ